MARTSRDSFERVLRRIVLSVMGREGHGKTRLLLTMPRPLLLFACDPNTIDVVCSYFKVDQPGDLDPEVCRLIRIPYPLVGFDTDERAIMGDAQDAWNTMADEINDLVRDRLTPRPRSVGLDSGTELNALNILKEFGRLDKISPNMRRARMGTVNNDFKGIFRALEYAGVHVGVTHRCKEHWETVSVRGRNGTEDKDQVVPGVYDRLGFREMGNICNTEILARFDPEREGRLSERFGIEILRSMQRPGVIGDVYWGSEEVHGEDVKVATFSFLATLLYPGTTLKDWE